MFRKGCVRRNLDRGVYISRLTSSFRSLMVAVMSCRAAQRSLSTSLPGNDEALRFGSWARADAVIDVRGLECVQDLQQCRLVKDRAVCPFSCTIGLVSLAIAR